MSDWMIFTDLDGTLLDHHDYSFTQALPALRKIQALQIPLIINSSKTYAEIKDIRQKLHNNWAFAVENGAAVFLPEGQLYGNDNQLQQYILGTAQSEILTALKTLREQYGYTFKGFSDFSITELMEHTGLTHTQSTQAKQRLASEPLKWLDNEKKLIHFREQLNIMGLQLIQGGRFLHVMGKNDKALAMSWILTKFNQKSQILALGDRQNDRKMLENADIAGVIRRADQHYLKLDKHPAKVIYSQHPAPLGWQEVIELMLTQLNNRKNNE